MSRITLEDLKKALEKVLEENDEDPHQAEDMAEKVMNLFGYDRSITDNLLSSDERDIFYQLEDFDILTTEEERTNLPSGKKWRIYYWVLNESRIKELLEEDEEEDIDETGSVYDEMANSVWQREKSD